MQEKSGVTLKSYLQEEDMRPLVLAQKVSSPQGETLREHTMPRKYVWSKKA